MSPTHSTGLRLPLAAGSEADTTVTVAADQLSLEQLVAWLQALQRLLGAHGFYVESLRHGQLRLAVEGQHCLLGPARGARSKYEWHPSVAEAMAKAQQLQEKVEASRGVLVFQRSDESLQRARRVVAQLVDSGLMMALEREIQRALEPERAENDRLRALLKAEPHAAFHVEAVPEADSVTLMVTGVRDEADLASRIAANLAPLLATMQEFRARQDQTKLAEFSASDLRLAPNLQVIEEVASRVLHILGPGSIALANAELRVMRTADRLDVELFSAATVSVVNNQVSLVCEASFNDAELLGALGMLGSVLRSRMQRPLVRPMKGKADETRSADA